MKRIIALLMALLLLGLQAAAFAETEPAPGIAKFTTTDLNGETFTEAYFQENGTKLILLNLWEPWCNPCVGELPELQKLYENYREKGLVVLGVFSYEDTQAAKRIIEAQGVTYPIVRFCDAFAAYKSGYVPTSVFLAPDGTVYEGPIIGARSYASWEKPVLQYLA